MTPVTTRLFPTRPSSSISTTTLTVRRSLPSTRLQRPPEIASGSIGPQRGDDRPLERLGRGALEPDHHTPAPRDRGSAMKREENLPRVLGPLRQKKRHAAAGLDAPDDPRLAPLEHFHDLVGVPFAPRLQKARDHEVPVQGRAHGK